MILFTAVQYMPRLETIENCMKLSQMLIQAVDVRTSPLLQLPHITQDMLKHFTTKKVQLTGKMDKIKTIANFYCLHHVWKVSRGIFLP